MSPVLYVRLWIMVFLHYFVWGTWYVAMGTYLEKTLGFTGAQIGLVYGSTAVGAMVSPFFAGIVADRFLPTQWMLGLLHLVGAALLAYLTTQTSFLSSAAGPGFYPVLILYTISYMAGHGLTNTLTLHHAKDPGREFPIVMMMGSVGWIAAGNLDSLLNVEKSAGMFWLASGAALVMGLYSFTLPHTPPKGAAAPLSIRTILGIDALSLMRNRSFATFILCSFLICIPCSFYFSWSHVFLGDLTVSDAASKLTIGQVSDVVFLLLLPFLMPRLGVKGILLLGMAAWALRFGLFATFAESPSQLALMYLGIALHGMCYDYIFVMGRMYVDKRASPEIRGAAQGLHAFVTLGIGMFVGTWLSGLIVDHYAATIFVYKEPRVVHFWQDIWMVPAALSVVLLPVFAALFHDRVEERPERL